MIRCSPLQPVRPQPIKIAAISKRCALKHARRVVRVNDRRAPNTPVTQGADAPLIDIEILSSDSGAPVVEMHGYAAEVMRVVRV